MCQTGTAGIGVDNGLSRSSAIVANSGDSLQQVHWLDPQGMRQTHNVQQRDIPFPALDSANIIAMQGR